MDHLDDRWTDKVERKTARAITFAWVKREIVSNLTRNWKYLEKIG